MPDVCSESYSVFNQLLLYYMLKLLLSKQLAGCVMFSVNHTV